MSTSEDPTAPEPAGDGHPLTSMPIIEKAGRQIRAPWAASIAGILFSILFTTALVLVRSQSDQSGQKTAVMIGGLYLAPFAGIMFLWFVAVIRDQIGEREDRFFATVFFGSGLLFVGLLFTTAAVVSTPDEALREHLLPHHRKAFLNACAPENRKISIRLASLGEIHSADIPELDISQLS